VAGNAANYRLFLGYPMFLSDSLMRDFTGVLQSGNQRVGIAQTPARHSVK
jgi:hypothetical protein